jgi:hypothetical protein
VDQRGVGRPQGADCDLGAYEMEVISLLQPSSIPSGVPSYEPSSERPSLTALQNLNCRAGPSTRHEIEDTLFEGVSAPIEGRDQESTWWYILSPNQGIYCWVSGEQVEIVGDVSQVRVQRASPPPTREAPTKPPAPQVDCTKYKDPEKCKANPACAWYTQAGSAGYCTYK